MKPWQPARVRPQKEVVSPLGLPGGQAWPEQDVIAECGALQGFPALPSVLSPGDPAANIPSDNVSVSKENQLSPDLLYVTRKTKSVIFTEPLGVALEPSRDPRWPFLPLGY